MDNEIVFKILQSLHTDRLGEPEVLYILALARKLTERVPSPQIRQYLLLKLYCDWVLHSKLDRSEAGGKILARLHDLIGADLDAPGDLRAFITKINEALSIRDVRLELNSLVKQFGGPPDIVTVDIWQKIAPMIIEIISNIPLSIGSAGGKMKTIAQGIQAKPLRGTTDVVQSLAIVRNSQLERASQDSNVLFWLEIMTSGNVNFRVPLRLN